MIFTASVCTVAAARGSASATTSGTCVCDRLRAGRCVGALLHARNRTDSNSACASAEYSVVCGTCEVLLYRSRGTPYVPPSPRAQGNNFVAVGYGRPTSRLTCPGGKIFALHTPMTIVRRRTSTYVHDIARSRDMETVENTSCNLRRPTRQPRRFSATRRIRGWLRRCGRSSSLYGLRAQCAFRWSRTVCRHWQRNGCQRRHC